MTKIYDFKMKDIKGNEADLAKFKNKVLLVVNVASKCGLTPQYEGLEALYKKYHDRGLEILAFPANEFKEQEPGTSAEIAQFCQVNYGVTFPLFEKIVVKGNAQNPLYTYLTNEKPEATLKPDGTLLDRLKSAGLLTGAPQDIKWNFEKFLIDIEGNIVERFSPEIAPTDSLITNAIEKELK